MTIQFLRGTTATNNLTTGQVGSITVDTTADNLRLHDGATAGGVTIPNEAGVETITREATGIQEATVAGQNFTYKENTRQVAFCYYFDEVKTVSSGANIVFNDAIQSSAHYNATTGVFTAPVAGIYFFNISLIRASTASTGQLEVWFSKNGAAHSVSLSTGIPAGIPATFPLNLSSILPLNANDTVAVKSNGTTLGITTPGNIFSGYLL